MKQFKYKCKTKGKIDFIAEIFEVCASTLTVIFVNTKKFAEILLNILKKRGLAVYIIFSDMTKEERDEFVEKFRKQEINVVITTNLLARGIDIPEIQLVINFDVPVIVDYKTKVWSADAENYLHRIGRAGRFGVQGIALTIFENERDEQFLNEIMQHYKMEDKL